MIDEVFRTEWSRLVAVLMRDFGDLELAEDCAQEAFVEASEKWGVAVAVPDKPGAWLTTTARRKALDRVRRSSNYKTKLDELEVRAKRGPTASTGGELIDEQLALLLGCCHPALNLETQVALTLRLVAGLTTAQIARAFLSEESAMSKRITRAKTKIRDASIPFREVDREDLVTRLNAVRHVIYLIFNEGYASVSDEDFVRGDLCDEAAWLASLLTELLPDDGESHSLHALILLTDARRSTRLDATGVPVMLEDQDRAAWDREKIELGVGVLRRAATLGSPGRFGLQAQLAAFHAAAPSFEDTNWSRIVCTYDLLATIDSSPVVALNRAVAVSFADGPEAGLDAIEPLRVDLAKYRYMHSARAELLRRLDRPAEAAENYVLALDCDPPEAERMFLERRLVSLNPVTP